MLKVTYQIREDKTDTVVDTIQKEFSDEQEKIRWETVQNTHPFLHLKEVKTAV